MLAQIQSCVTTQKVIKTRKNGFGLVFVSGKTEKSSLHCSDGRPPPTKGRRTHAFDLLLWKEQ